jgi:hypothetical protein
MDTSTLPDDSFTISGFKTSSNQDVDISISHLYIGATNSNRGSVIKTVNIGDLDNPFSLDLLDGNQNGVDVANTAVFQLSAPTLGVNGNRTSGSADLGIRLNLEVNNVKTQYLETHVEGLNIDGSAIKLWGTNNAGSLEAELNINLHADAIEFLVCNDSSTCGDSLKFNNVNLDIQLGDNDYQPVTFDIMSDGNFKFEVASLAGKCVLTSGACRSNAAGYNDLEEFYDNGPKSNIGVGSVQFGGRNFGSSTISGLEIQYLKITSHDI